MKNGRTVLLISILGALAVSSLQASDRPRLIVQITVDQLRGDLPLRYRDRFGDGGSRYFMDHGTWYTAARYAHSHTETIVGHTTLATGAYPSRHGMVGNKWFDRSTRTFVDNIAAPEYPLLSVNGETQKSKGTSPMRILTTTFSDELAIATNGKAKIFSVAGKDRGAIPMAGHSGKAFWFSGTNGCFVSSAFYYSSYPSWVTSWCKQNPAQQYAKGSWNLLHDRSTYLFSNVTNTYPAGSVAAANMAFLASIGFGSTFPHKLPGGSALYESLIPTPFGDELTLNFAEELIRAEKLGKDAVPDYLAIGFTSTDIIAHWFSPASLESEDNMLRLDETLQKLLVFIDKEVGLKNTLVVISGDHGGPDYPEYLATLGVNTGRLTPDVIMNAANQALAARYPSINGIILQYAQPYFYLDPNVIAQNKLDQAEVERVLAKGLMTLPGVAAALTSSDMRSGTGDLDAELAMQIRRNYNPARSGEVYLVQLPQWQISEKTDDGSNLLQHGSPWTYDTYVPVAFAGGEVPHAMIARDIYTVDVAATLATMLRTKFPSGCAGVPLTEVIAPIKSITAKRSH